ncbi:MAG: TlyA family RNA methyltransferase [Candidatus Eremiobacter antarcticus]
MPSNARQRLDITVATQRAVSRERAQALILAGRVSVNGAIVTKAGSQVPASAAVDVTPDDGYVGRGGRKLEHALQEFGWSPAGLRCLDVGASTGGFTDCLLRAGAQCVTALDVGYGQLAWSLRNDERVSVVERCNFRTVGAADLGAPFAFCCADVSFISLTKLAYKFAEVMEDAGRLIVLIKPQFEAGRAAVSRGGVVRDPDVQRSAIESVIAALARARLTASCLTYSPLKGPAGNIEFLLGAIRNAAAAVSTIDIAGAVREAHEALD